MRSVTGRSSGRPAEPNAVLVVPDLLLVAHDAPISHSVTAPSEPPPRRRHHFVGSGGNRESWVSHVASSSGRTDTCACLATAHRPPHLRPSASVSARHRCCGSRASDSLIYLCALTHSDTDLAAAAAARSAAAATTTTKLCANSSSISDHARKLLTQRQRKRTPIPFGQFNPRPKTEGSFYYSPFRAAGLRREEYLDDEKIERGVPCTAVSSQHYGCFCGFISCAANWRFMFAQLNIRHPTHQTSLTCHASPWDKFCRQFIHLIALSPRLNFEKYCARK